MKDMLIPITEFFDEIKFNQKQHSYSVNKKRLPSVSKLLGDFYYPFETDKVATKVAGYGKKTKKELIKEWDDTRIEACDRGHRVHDFGEKYVWDRTLKPSCPQEEAVVKFWDEMPDHIVPVTMEIQMFHKLFGYAGTADILLFNKRTRCFIIADYKTNKDLFKNFKGKKMKYPFTYLLDMPYSKYQLQLTFYQILFEQTGYKVEDRKIVWLKLDGTYNMYSTEDFSSELKYYLLNRN